MAEISATEPDWSRETLRRWWDPSRQLLRSIRRYQAAERTDSAMAPITRRYWVFWHRFWSVVTGADIPLNCQIEGGLVLTHPNGVVVHPTAKIGPNCLLLQQVTLVGGVVLRGHVDISAGAKIIKPVVIGEHAVIGANAVVTKDVEPGTTVVGIPARPISS